MRVSDLKAVNYDKIDVDEAVALLGFGNMMQSQYRSSGLEVPEWLKDSVSSLEKDVARRKRDSLERALKSALARRDALKTADEKRREAEADIARINAALGNAPAT